MMLLLVLENATPAVPPPAPLMASVWMSASVSALTVIPPLPVPSDRLLLFSVALRCWSTVLTATAAPTAAVPAPCTLPARVLMSASPRVTCTVTLLPPVRVTPSSEAFSSPSITFTATEPPTAAVPAPPAPTAAERMCESPPLCTVSAPVRPSVALLMLASRVARMTLLALATPTAAVPAPLMAPARLQMVRSPSAAETLSAPTVTLPPSTFAVSLPSRMLLVDEPFTAASPAPPPATAMA